MKKQLCAVQMHWKVSDYRAPVAFENKINSIMKKIREKTGPDVISLVVFPEDVGTPLVFLNSYEKVKNASTIEQAVKILIRMNLPKVLFYRARFGVGWIRALALAKSREMARVYFDVFSRMAKHYGVYIIAGSILLPGFQWERDPGKTRYSISDGNVYNIAFLFDYEGKLAGVQKKTHLVPGLEDKDGFDLCPGVIDELEVFDTPFGKIGIAICLDCFKEPVIESLASKGADILVQPSANSKVWDKAEQEGWMEGCFKAMKTEKRFKYGINPMMTGCLFDLCFEGQSSILSNVDLAGDNNGNDNEKSMKNRMKNNLAGKPESKLPRGSIMLGYKDLDKVESFVRMAETSSGEEVLFFEIP
ncbi:MAG: hypothetical protein GX754_06950 [Clostridiaceae bacterium]|nr:hypothetical protein [Clostridiaceae bacterium]